MEFLNSKFYGKYCFDVLINHLKGNKIPNLPKEIKDEKYPLFVTWKFSKNGNLRGCIGNFGSELLSKNLKKYALISALEDTRFNPIDIKEVPKLSNTVYLLYKFEENKECMDWEVGKHGIEIFFKKYNNNYHSTFLPSVMIEHNMSKEEAINSLIEKSGYYGKEKIKYSDITITRYQGIQFNLSYKEYLEM